MADEGVRPEFGPTWGQKEADPAPKIDPKKCSDLHGCTHCIFSQQSGAKYKTMKMKGGGEGDILKGEIKEESAISLCLAISRIIIKEIKSVFP